MKGLQRIMTDHLDIIAVEALFATLNSGGYGCCGDCPRDQERLISTFRKELRARLHPDESKDTEND